MFSLSVTVNISGHCFSLFHFIFFNPVGSEALGVQTVRLPSGILKLLSPGAGIQLLVTKTSNLSEPELWGWEGKTSWIGWSLGVSELRPSLGPFFPGQRRASPSTGHLCRAYTAAAYGSAP